MLQVPFAQAMLYRCKLSTYSLLPRDEKSQGRFTVNDPSMTSR